MLGIFLGLMAAACWGCADFLVRYSTRLIGSYRTLLFMQFVGLLGLSIYLFATGELIHLIVSKTWQSWAWAILVVLLSMLSSLALYRAFEIGILMIVSPVTSCYAAVTVALSFLVGERISQLHTFGLVTILAGIMPVAGAFTRPIRLHKTPDGRVDKVHARRLPRGLGWAVFAACGYGVSFWLLGFRVTPELGGLVPVWLMRLLTPCLLVFCAPLVRQSVRLPSVRMWWYLTGIGIIDTVAFVAYSFGLMQGQIAIVSVLSSLYSVVTVILAWIFIRERLQWSQWLGMGVVFLGIVLVNI